MPELRFEVITDPVAKARPRVAVRGGRAHAYTPSKTENAEWRIRSRFIELFPRFTPLEGPLILVVDAFVAMPTSIPKKRQQDAQPVTRPDVDNYLKTVLDSLNGVAFRDDSQVVRVTCDKHYARPPKSPRWEITIYPLNMPRPALRQESQQHVPPAGDSAHGTSASAG